MSNGQSQILDAQHLRGTSYPVDVEVASTLHHRNRVTALFRPVLALPHLLLVGGPLGFAFSFTWRGDGDFRLGGVTGALGALAAVAALITWFAIVFTGRAPAGLLDLVRLYLRWRVRAVSYMALLRDEYPPFGDAPYPAELRLTPVSSERDRLTVAFRPLLVIPHLLIVWALGVVWLFTSIIAWLSVLFTGNYPEPLYHFAIGVLRWSTRVEAYLLLLDDAYPPFSLD